MATMTRSPARCLSLIVIYLCFLKDAAALIVPPADKIRMGMTEMLKEECVDNTGDSHRFLWEFDVEAEYQLAATVFTRLAQCDRERTKIWLPSCSNRQGEVDRLANALNDNSDRLGGLHTICQHWPEVPATVLELDWDQESTRPFYEKETEAQIEAAVKDTENYVEKKLCRLGLCPYTKSMQRAAIGLESFGVHEGPVVIRHAASMIPDIAKSTTPAAVMTAMYWKGVTELIERPEEEVATLLLVAPSYYDDNFDEYYKTCDNLIEKSVALLSGSVGRVWFHPKYDLKQVGYSTGGHTLPLDVVKGFLDQYLVEHPGATRPNSEDMARAHDETRRTPHATINLLRGSQLKKAKDNQNRAKVYARNILQILEDEKSKTS